jgi:hypothetical protein
MSATRERNFLEAFLTNAEVALDSLSDNDAVRSVPVVGTALKICKGLDDLRSRALMAKLEAFLSDPATQSQVDFPGFSGHAAVSDQVTA